MSSRREGLPNDNLSAGLLACWQAGVHAAHPAEGVRRALEALGCPPRAPWIIAIGKAAVPMAEAALACLAAHDRAAAGGVAVVATPAAVPGLEVVVGDHPVPGPGSRAAAAAVARLTARLPAGVPVWVLLSGGASSLAAAPQPWVSVEDLQRTFDLLLGSGLEITAMNRVRKRLTTLGGGGLLRALGHRPILQLVVSDVLGDDLPTIGSGPLVGDDAGPPALPATLRAALPQGVSALLAEGHDPVMSRREAEGYTVATELIASNRVALEAAAAAAERLGWRVVRREAPLSGEAAAAGRQLVEESLATPPAPVPTVLIAGGETTVTLGPGAAGLGGRCQELALAAAQAMTGRAIPMALLAAGTDGRDGSSEAAGAVVTPATWGTIAALGRDPAEALARHDSHPALVAARAAVFTGPTGTNVADLVLVVRDGDRGPVPSAGPGAP